MAPRMLDAKEEGVVGVGRVAVVPGGCATCVSEFACGSAGVAWFCLTSPVEVLATILLSFVVKLIEGEDSVSVALERIGTGFM